MYRRLIILTVIILSALCGLTWLGHHALRKWAQGLEGARLAEFAAVSEQIERDVKRKLDRFMQTEQNRPYTDYQYYYVPADAVATQQQVPVMRSPLAGQIENNLAYGNFQIEPDGQITTANDEIVQREGRTDLNKKIQALALDNRRNIEHNLLPALETAAPGSIEVNIDKKELSLSSRKTDAPAPQLDYSQSVQQDFEKKSAAKSGKSKGSRGRNIYIESFRDQGRKTQVIRQKRAQYDYNVTSNAARSEQQAEPSYQTQQTGQSSPAKLNAPQKQPAAKSERSQGMMERMFGGRSGTPAEQQAKEAPASDPAQSQSFAQQISSDLLVQAKQQVNGETVQIRIEPFVPLVVPAQNAGESVFGGQVFFLRHVRIEDRHLLQGFQLNEKRLVEEIKNSAARSMRPGMDFELSKTENRNSAFTAVLDFGFGGLVLNLVETDPAWVHKQISRFGKWYFSITAVVFGAVALALVSLWRNLRAQIKLARKKDDFISAVSHELRTPLTSIRMYAEMLEKNWVKSPKKLTEYYRSMRQESERLSRLIENVLDFSRIQKQTKKYTFTIGSINLCITDVVEMMQPYAAQHGFTIETDLAPLSQTTFDRDAVTQIVVNLLDNAVKYARDANEKTITVRTRSDTEFILIEVEDHGPGVPHRQRRKVFEQFYRTGSEATRETNGTGLGLALVKKFTEAHDGFVEILSAKPTGAIFRVALASQS